MSDEREYVYQCRRCLRASHKPYSWCPACCTHTIGKFLLSRFEVLPSGYRPDTSAEKLIVLTKKGAGVTPNRYRLAAPRPNGSDD